MPMLEEIATRLAPYGTLGTDLFLGYMPDAPDACTALYSLPGSPPSETMALLPFAENLSLQIMVRASTYAAAETACRAMWLDLLEVLDLTLSGTRYLRISSLQSPYLAERDEQRRVIFTANFSVSREIS